MLPRIVAVLTATSLVCAGLVSTARAADDDLPTRREVREARSAVTAGERDVAAVRADLTAARDRAVTAEIRAAKAAEAFNGARYAAGLARDGSDAARAEKEAATAEVERLRSTYRRAAVDAYTSGSNLSAAAALLESDGVTDLLEQIGSVRIGEQVLSARGDELDAAEDLATAAGERAQAAETQAVQAAEASRVARDEAQAASDDATAEEQATQARRQQLVAELADLQGIGVRLAERRQSGLEKRRAEAAAAAARTQQERLEQLAQQQSEQSEQSEQQEQVTDPEPSTDPEPTPDPAPSTDPEPTPDPAPEEPHSPAPAPAPSGGAADAIAFARAQIGEPYQWAAAGPGSWDCSGLTMGAWGAAGRSLPHYSVAQYEQSTAISAADLQPGDLVFWGDSGDPSSIYHVALYAGDGMIIHAPRTGRPVTEESLYYWIAPDFYARP